MHTALVRWDRDERCLEWRVACDMRDGRAQCRTELSRETWNTTVFQGADRRTEPTLVGAKRGGGTQAMLLAAIDPASLREWRARTR